MSTLGSEIAGFWYCNVKNEVILEARQVMRNDQAGKKPKRGTERIVDMSPKIAFVMGKRLELATASAFKCHAG